MQFQKERGLIKDVRIEHMSFHIVFQLNSISPKLDYYEPEPSSSMSFIIGIQQQ